jgi:hypothetical protein
MQHSFACFRPPLRPSQPAYPIILMKILLVLSPSLKASVAGLVSILPRHISMAVGVEQDSAMPYFMDIRVSTAGLTRAREKVVFETEEQVIVAIEVLYRRLGLTPNNVASLARPGFTDLSREIARMGATTSIMA